jgi:2,3-bisphosphoglycerate-independent phosphoglycerate mutase
MADRPIAELDGRTPLEVANKPNMDFIARHGRCGMVKTIPAGMPPGSDVASLAVMGYDPEIYYTGRASIEAVSMGITLADGDFCYRCNLVTLSEAAVYDDAVIIDHSAGDISTAEATTLIEMLAREFGVELYAGFSYRHCLVLRSAEPGAIHTPPQDILGKPISEHLPRGQNAEFFTSMIKRSRDILKNHPVNLERIRQKLRPASSIWFWGEGSRLVVPAFVEKYGINGSVISAVDLVKGIGICSGLQIIKVPGATGTLNTNYRGKADAALEALKTQAFVYLHVEAPDECAHQGDVHSKILAIEYIDQKIVGPVMAELNSRGEEYSIMVLPDHATPVELRTHTDEPVPFAYYRHSESRMADESASVEGFTEKNASSTGIYIGKGYTLLDEFIQ